MHSGPAITVAALQATARGVVEGERWQVEKVGAGELIEVQCGPAWARTVPQAAEAGRSDR